MCTPDSENSSPEHGDLTSQLVGKQKLRLRGIEHTARQGLARLPLHCVRNPMVVDVILWCVQGHPVRLRGPGCFHFPHVPRRARKALPVGLGGLSRAC